MSCSIVAETLYGRHQTYQVRRSPGGLLAAPAHSIWRDGQYWRGSFASHARAVEIARDAG